jgi:hypothetical protein
MKAILYPLIVLVTSSCNTAPDEQSSNLPGAYKLLTKNIKGNSIDSLADGLNQLKIYTEDYFMYAAINTHDTVASFAIGSYKNKGRKITENVLFSANGTNNLEPGSIILDIKKTPEGYEQTITDTSSAQGEKLSYFEKYKYVGAKTKSIIDGVWKQIEIYSVNDRDTTWDRGTNYKICYDGYVIWADYHMIPATQKYDTYMGFGTIEDNGKNKVKEFYLKSNYTINEGKTFYIDIEFRNKDVFKQTIIDSLTNTKYIEVYQRLNMQ